MTEKQRQDFDDYGIVIDYIPPGVDRSVFEPIAHIIGTRTFTLLEVVLKDNVFLTIGDEVYIGPEKREHVKFIRRRISYDELSSAAKEELRYILFRLVRKNEKTYVDFFNNAQSITPKRHQLELLPGVGKRLLQRILDEREKGPFKSFEDIEKRTGIKNVAELIVNRIIIELSGGDKYNLFVKQPQKRKAPRSAK